MGPKPLSKMLLCNKDPHAGTGPERGAMSLPAYDFPITQQALRLPGNPVKGNLVTSRWEASVKTRRELLLSRTGGDWNWPGWRLAINVLSSQERRSLDAEDPGGKAGVMNRVPTPA